MCAARHGRLGLHGARRAPRVSRRGVGSCRAARRPDRRACRLDHMHDHMLDINRIAGGPARRGRCARGARARGAGGSWRGPTTVNDDIKETEVKNRTWRFIHIHRIHDSHAKIGPAGGAAGVTSLESRTHRYITSHSYCAILACRPPPSTCTSHHAFPSGAQAAACLRPGTGSASAASTSLEATPQRATTSQRVEGPPRAVAHAPSSR